MAVDGPWNTPGSKKQPEVVSSNVRVGTGAELERLRWSLEAVKKEVTAVNPDWGRVMRIFEEAGPCSSDASLVVRVCNAYEHGFGQAGRALDNPYEMLTAEAEAWNIGWQEGKKRNAVETSGELEAVCEEIRNKAQSSVGNYGLGNYVAIHRELLGSMCAILDRRAMKSSCVESNPAVPDSPSESASHNSDSVAGAAGPIRRTPQ